MLNRSRKLLYLYLLLGVIFFIYTSLIIITKTQHPEILLIGKWKEIYWNYERVDNTDIVSKENLDDEVKQEISKHLLIHQAEIWEFNKDSRLTLKSKEKISKLNWKLKGRGHILKLTYKDGMKEYYQIKELTKNKLVLHFENDIHARGIVKIVFTK
jgi:hypothetical protein